MTNLERRTSGFKGSVQKVSDTVKLKGIQYNTIFKTYKAPYVTKMLFVGAGVTRD